MVRQPTPSRRAPFIAPPRRSFFGRYWFPLLLLVVLAAAGAVYYFNFYDTAESAEVAPVVRGTALQGVYGTVDVEPVNEVIVRTRNFGLPFQGQLQGG